MVLGKEFFVKRERLLKQFSTEQLKLWIGMQFLSSNDRQEIIHCFKRISQCAIGPHPFILRSLACSPGVSSSTSCPRSVVSTPRTRVRVVCGVGETMATLWPHI